MANINVRIRLRANATGQLFQLVFGSGARATCGFLAVTLRRNALYLSIGADGEING